MQYVHFFHFLLYFFYSKNVLVVTGLLPVSSSSSLRVKAYRYRHLSLVTNQSSFHDRQNHFLFFSRQQQEEEEEGKEQQNDQLESSQTTIDKNNNDTSSSSKTTSSDNINQKRDVSFQIFKLFSYVLQFMGLYFSFGLLLNILGYGYYIDLDSFKNNSGGLMRIDKRNIIQNELQFKNEIKKSSSISDSIRSVSSGSNMDLSFDK